MSALAIVLFVVGSLVLLFVVLVATAAWVGRRLRRSEAALRARVQADERFVLEPAVGNYRGASARYGVVKGTAMIAVTDRRVLIDKALGAPIEVPLAEVKGVREDRWFLRSFNSLPHLVLQLADGVEVGLQVRDHARWLEVLRATVGQRLR